MKNLAYLEAFSIKSLREARRILNKGFTVEDIDRFLEDKIEPIATIIDNDTTKPKKLKPSRRLPRGARRHIMANTKFGKRKP